MASLLLPLSTLFLLVSAQKCPIQFEGRVSQASTLDTFDTSASLFNPGYVLGASMLCRVFPLPSSHSPPPVESEGECSLTILARSKMEQRPEIPKREQLTCKFTSQSLTRSIPKAFPSGNQYPDNQLQFDANGTKAVEVTVKYLPLPPFPLTNLTPSQRQIHLRPLFHKRPNRFPPR